MSAASPLPLGHAPVLLHEAVDALGVSTGDVVVDATFGAGGYAGALLAKGATVIALDRDPAAAARAEALKRAFPERFSFRPGRFADLATLAPERLDGAVFDLGVSSFQLDEAERGFSFRMDAALDMRMSLSGPSAADAVARLSETALADVIFAYGEETGARRIARAIARARAEAPIESTGALADLVERALGGRKGARTHPATKTFQALRILVNDELNELARGLSAAEARLKPGGRLVVVSFHSLEDRIVKRFLAERAAERPAGSRHTPAAPPGPAPSFSLLHRKSVAPSEAEIAANPRARSARLRAAVRTDASAFSFTESDLLPDTTRREWERL